MRFEQGLPPLAKNGARPWHRKRKKKPVGDARVGGLKKPGESTRSVSEHEERRERVRNLVAIQAMLISDMIAYRTLTLQSPEGVKANLIITNCIIEWSRKYLKTRIPLANWVECEHGAVRVFECTELGIERRRIADRSKTSECNWGNEFDAEGYVMNDGSKV